MSGIRPEAYDTIDNTTHLVAAVFTITGISGIFDSDANSDASLVGSDGVTYQFTDHFAANPAYANFNYGDTIT